MATFASCVCSLSARHATLKMAPELLLGAAVVQAKPTSKSVVELVKELTGASEEDIQHTLQECNYDVNEATNKLIDGELCRLCCHVQVLLTSFVVRS